MNPRVEAPITTATSEPREKWCPACKAYTAVAFDVHALFPTGLTWLGTFTVCELCDDPSDQEDTRV
ncbi:hypothetical protein [Streptomyces parvulus]|uniref:hypothetical protein n=1 Tax=Streptomyces parvulus TaxID=146923 RepID=UPI0038149BBD